MSWSTIRKATHDDHETLNHRAEAFMARHNIPPPTPPELTDATELWRHLDAYLDQRALSGSWLNMQDGKHLRRLWIAILRRAVGHPAAEGIAYGYIGYHAD